MNFKKKHRSGFALMLVILEVALMAALWGIAFRQLSSTMRMLDYLNQQGQPQLGSSQNVDGYKPLARALSLLETGEPPDGGTGFYTCNATILTSSGPAYFLIVYQKVEDGSSSSNESWTVTSTQQYPSSSAQAASWDNMPATFASGH
jgi:hypothetical protein